MNHNPHAHAAGKPVPAAKSDSRILIVDDHPLVRRGISELISTEPGLQVCGEAANEEDALQQVEKLLPDLVIIDISLKQGNGIDLIKRIKVLNPAVRMLVSSMYEEDHYAERVLRAGAMGYVHKQEPSQTLVEAIRQVLQGRIYLSSHMTSRMLRRAMGAHDYSDRSPVDGLSDRELEVFELIGHGLTTSQIAEKLELSLKTVETYRERLKNKLNLKNAAELSYRAVQWVLEKA